MLDSIDQALIQALKVDARSSYAELGASANLAPEVVRLRVKRMIESQQLRIFGVVEPAALGFHVLANVSISFRGDPSNFAQQIRTLPGVSYLSATIGRTNILCEIAAENDAALADFVAKEIANVPGVETFEVSRVVEVKKWIGLGGLADLPLPDVADFDLLEPLDVAILREMLVDPRIKITRLAGLVDASYSSVRKRVSQLLERKVIQAVAATDRISPDQGPIAIVQLARVNKSAWATISVFSEVKIASRTIGAHAGLLEVHASGMEELVETLDRLGCCSGVKISETLLLAKTMMIPTSWRFRNLRTQPVGD